jgi:signal transduction histidine kinase
LAELANTTNELQNIRCRFACSGVSSIPNNLIATQLYRIAQESLNNALKHAAPDLIEILLTQEHQKITLEIRDNGVGLNSASPPEEPIRGRGIGLRIMEYRASVLGGTLEFENNATGSGMTLRCIVPLNEGST